MRIYKLNDYKKQRRQGSPSGVVFVLFFAIAYVSGFTRVEGEVAYRSHQTVNAERNYRKKEVRQRSRLVSVGFKRSVIDYQTANPPEEESE